MDDHGLLLLVDDDVALLRSLEMLLVGHGYEVEATPSSSQALVLIDEHPFDVVVLDLNMPVVDGLGILKRLDNDPRNIKSIVVSGELSLKNVTPVLRHGASDYLPKPCEPELLLSSLRNLIARKRLEDENRSMQRRVEQSEHLHRYLVHQSPDMIYMLDDDGRFIFLNSRAESVFGCPRSELLGQHWSTLFPGATAANAIHRFNERRTGSRSAKEIELRAVSPAHPEQPIFLEVTAMGMWRPDRDGNVSFHGTYGVARDVTERRTTATALVETREKFFGLFQNSPDAIFISRLDDGSIVDSNENFHRVLARLGRPAGPIDNDRVIWTNPEDRHLFLSLLAQYPDRLVHEVTLDGTHGQRQVELTARRMRLEGEDCVLTTVRDQTRYRQAEADRLALESQLHQARKMETIGQLAGGIAHDFNNILASIIGYTELAQLAESQISAEQRHNYLEQVVNASTRARDLIAQLLSFSRANRVNAQYLDVSEEAVESMRMIRAAIPSSITIDQWIKSGLTPIFIDPVQLQQVLINLFVNARDAIGGRPGRIDLHVDESTVERDVCPACGNHFDGEFVQVRVVDSGKGIELDMLPQVFELYVSGSEKRHGNGMGLAMANRIVHEYGGHFLVESQPGRGTEFSVLLPLANDSVEAPPITWTGGRIVVVDDEVSVGNYIAEALGSCGFDVVRYGDGPAAIDYLEAYEGKVDMLITDQAMPQLSGLEVCRRARIKRPSMPVVLICNDRNAVSEEDATEAGVAWQLCKPFTVEDLLRLVQNVLEPSRVAPDGLLMAEPGRSDPHQDQDQASPDHRLPADGSAVSSNPGSKPSDGSVSPAPTEGPDPLVVAGQS